MNNPKRLVILFNPSSLRGVGEESSPPIGLLMAAINLYENYRVVIIDQRVERGWESCLLRLLKEKPVCIGITALTGKQIQKGIQVSKIAKLKGCPVVWGGVHASIIPTQTLAHPAVDYVVEGEGEESFAQLVEAITLEKSCEGIPGVWTKNNGNFHFGGKRPFLNLNILPLIPYHLIDLAKYIKPSPYGMTTVLYTSRGCPQKCTFCYNKSFNQSRWRSFSVDRTLNDIERIRKTFPIINHFQFWDDDFFVDLNRVRNIAEGIKKISPTLTWSVLGAHIRDIYRMEDDFLSCLRESGLKKVLVGVESGSQRMIDLIQKNFKVNQLFSCNKRLGKYEIGVTYSFISGVPEEKDEDIKKTIEAIFRLKKENPAIVVGNIKPCLFYPGTSLYEKSIELGFKPPSSLDDWSNFVWGNYMNIKCPWVTKKKRWFLTCLYYYTVLMSPEYFLIQSKLFTFIASMLSPIAKWRVKRLWFRFPIEAWFLYIIQRFFL